jgi:hypothetical protein
MRNDSALSIVSRGILAFVMARWQESGGFGFAPTLPASVEDTYHSLRILEEIRPVSEERLGILKRNSRLGAFLRRAEDKETWSIKTASQYAFCCVFMGLASELSWLNHFLGTRLSHSPDLTDHYYAARTVREWVPQMDIPLIEHTPVNWRSARDLWMVLYLNGGTIERLKTTKVDLIKWLQACQNPDGGFGCLPGTTSFIENCHWCMRALALLGEKPLFRDMARDFILRCRTSGGGFARKNGAAPFLYATWHAVSGLGSLSQMSESPSPEPLEAQPL